MPYNPYYQNYMPNMQYQVPQTSVIHVQNEAQAREWNVAPGGSIMFIDDNSPFCYTKTAGYSQLEPAVFKRFKIIEDTAPQSVQVAPQPASEPEQVNVAEYITKAEFEPFKTLIEELQIKIKELVDDESAEQ